MSANKYSKQDCIESLKQVTDELGHFPSVPEYRSVDIDGPSTWVIKQRWDSWNDMKESIPFADNPDIKLSDEYDGCPEILTYSDKEWENLSANYKCVHRKRARIAETKIEEGCKICGYNKSPASLTFHHLNPDEKNGSICTLTNDGASWKKLQNEMDKCEILCRNCHQEKEHGDKYDLSD